MSSELRNAYRKIAQDYLQKKHGPWKDFASYIEKIKDFPAYRDLKATTVLDIGGGNGRNAPLITSSLSVIGDLSFDLLLGVPQAANVQPVALALPYLPFRSNSADLVLLIAVLHHLQSSADVIDSLLDCKRTNPDGKFIISVWRKWRDKNKQKIVARLKEGREVDSLTNHQLPWHKRDGSVLATRFYHYYTFKELHSQLSRVDLCIVNYCYLGGKSEKDNIFVLTKSSEN